jgi:predicted ATPase
MYVDRLERIREELQKTKQRNVSLPGLVEEILSDWLYVAESELQLSPRVLPVEEIDGKRYYRDNRLQEYRNVTNPHDRIPFSAKMH